MEMPTIGILAPWMNGEYLGNILIAMREQARRHGMQVMMTCTGVQTTSQRDRADVIPYPLGADHIAAWVLVGDALERTALERLEQTGAPIVTISSNELAGLCPLIVGDNAGGMGAATQHLIDHGHTRIGFIGVHTISDMVERRDGFLAIMHANGLEVDPALLFDVPGPWIAYGEQVAQQLIERGMPCSALLCGNDDLAFGVLERLRRERYRVPEDLAVIGFDDREEAQFQDPPLSTVSQKSYAMGVKAVELVTQMLAGQTIDKATTYRLPTALVRRESCGCGMDDLALLGDGAPGAQLHDSWQALLAERLLALALYPVKPDQDLTVDEQWPALGQLIKLVEAALAGADEPSPQETRQAWSEALTLTSNLKLLHSMISLLEQTGQAQIVEREDRAAAGKRLERAVERLRYDLSQTLLSAESQKSLLYNNERRKNGLLTEALLHSNWFVNNDLSWLRRTSNQAGCLGLWQGRSIQEAPTLTVKGTYSAQGRLLPEVGQEVPWTRFLPTALAPDSPPLRDDEIVLMVPFETPLAIGGVLCLVERIDQLFLQHYEESYHWVYTMAIAIEREVMLAELTQQQATLFTKNLELERARSEAEAAREAAEDANKFKSTFIANMSHELRTPLNTIINFTDFMGDEGISGSLNEQQQMLQGRVITSAEHLLGLINDILDLSKIESGKMELFPEPVSLVPLLESVMASAIGLTKDKGLRLNLELPEDSLLIANADKVRIRQVLLNLLSNAAKFTERGEITLRAVEHDDGTIEISVRDTGIGISADKQHLVFEEFRQVEAETNRKHGGTGLGMPISKRFVELHGGTMWLESTPGAGSTFFFTLPGEQARSRHQPEGQGEAPAEGQGERGRPRILVVDDDVSVHDIIRAHLHGQGYQIEGCQDSRRALAQIQDRPPSLIILDLNMPHIGGWELLTTLRDDPRTRTIPVIICSVLDQQRLGVALGAQAYLSKPTRADELLPVVRRWLAPSETVLVVDDDQAARQIVRTHLEQQGYQVAEAVDGYDGLRQLELARPQIIILDLMMPEMDGFEMLQRLRVLPGQRALPVVILTAKELSAEERALLQDQATACVQKHALDASSFVARVHELIRG